MESMIKSAGNWYTSKAQAMADAAMFNRASSNGSGDTRVARRMRYLTVRALVIADRMS